MSLSYRAIIATCLSLVIFSLSIGRGLPLLENEWLQVILASILLILPGGLLDHVLSARDDWSWVRFIAVGLPVSIGIIGVLGLIARTIGLNMMTIKVIWMALSLVLLFYVALVKPPQFFKPTWHHPSAFYIFLVFIAIGMFMFVAPTELKKTNDIMLYHAQVVHFADSQIMDWNEIYFSTGNRISDRFYLSYWTLAQALVISLSEVHIFQAQLTIQALLVGYVGSAVYVLSRIFGYDSRRRLFIVLLHMLIFSLALGQAQIGAELLQRLIQDKVFAGLGLSLIGIGIAYEVIQHPTMQKYVLFALVMLGLVFTHPIMSGIILGIILLWFGFNIVSHRQLRPYLWVMLIAFILFSPNLVIRLTTDAGEFYNFGSEQIEPDYRIWLSDDGNIYFPAPDIVHALTYLLLSVGLLVSLRHMRRSDHDRFYLATILVVGFGLLPYTAHLYAQVISVYHVYRVVWVVPYGLLLWYILDNLLLTQLPKKHRFRQILPFIGLCIVIMIGWQLQDVIQERLMLDENQERQLRMNDEFIEIGRYIEAVETERVTVLSSHVQRFADFIPAISTRLRPVAFCDERCMIAYTRIDPDTADRRRGRQQNFFTDLHDNDKRLDNLDRYDVRYIIYDKTADQSYINDLMTAYPNQFEAVYDTPSIGVVIYRSEG